MTTNFTSLGLVVLAGFVATAAVPASARKPVQQGSPKFDALVKCRAIADPAQRLACYDQNVAPIETAIAKKELLIIDRGKAEEANRSLFGYGSSGIGQFLGIDNLDSIESTVASTTSNADGGIIVTLADGSRWSQQDDKPMWGDVKKGAKVKIVRGTLGSYIVRISGQVGFKAIRIG